MSFICIIHLWLLYVCFSFISIFFIYYVYLAFICIMYIWLFCTYTFPTEAYWKSKSGYFTIASTAVVLSEHLPRPGLTRANCLPQAEVYLAFSPTHSYRVGKLRTPSYKVKNKLQLFIDVHIKCKLIRLHIMQKITRKPYIKLWNRLFGKKNNTFPTEADWEGFSWCHYSISYFYTQTNRFLMLVQLNQSLNFHNSILIDFSLNGIQFGDQSIKRNFVCCQIDRNSVITI